MNPLFKLCLLGAALAAASSCGIRRVPGDVLSKLPYEAKIELLEAENDLAVAIDKVDEAHNEMLRHRDSIRRARARLSSAEREVGEAKDDVSREVARLAVKEGDARVEYLRARQQVNVMEERIADRALTCAQARFELARLTAAKKAKLEGSERLEQADFEAQVKSCDARVDELRADQKKIADEAEKVRALWDQEKAALAKRTFDARASPFVE
jgi:chromosome segregation ATPase